MSQFLRQSTASQEVLLGPFLDDTDGKTAEVALTIANTDIKLWVAGAMSEASKNSGGATHVAAGRYYAVLDATDTATVGPGEINVAVAGALPVKLKFVVLHANVYDVLFGSVAPSTLAGVAQTGDSFARIGTNGAGLTAVGDIRLANLDATVGSRSTFSGGAVASVTGSVGSVSGNVDGSVGSVAGNVAGSVAQVNALAAGVVTAASIAADALTAAKFAADVTTELQSGLATASALATLATAVGVIDDLIDTEVAAIKVVTDKLGTAVELDGSVYRFTANALEQTPAGGSTTDWSADERTAIRTILGVPASGTTPAAPGAGALKVIDDLLDTELADIQARLPAALVSGRIDASVGAMADDVLTAEAVADDAEGPTLADFAEAVGDILIETGVTLRQSLAIIGAATAGKASGLDTSTATYYAMGPSGTSTARIVATVDEGNRTATTLTLPT